VVLIQAEVSLPVLEVIRRAGIIGSISDPRPLFSMIPLTLYRREIVHSTIDSLLAA
jgi:hypothetical protein